MGHQMWIGRMRGEDRRSGSLFSYVDLEARVAADHPLRTIRTIVDDALSGLSGEFEALYSHLAGLRSRPSGCCGHFSCRRSTRCVRSGC